MATVTKPVALNESLNTTDSTPKNIADVLKDKLGDIASAISGGSGGIFYGTCTGEEANQIKAVTVSNEQNFKLKAGSILAVKFDANNTYSATTENPVKLNVNNTGAKQIYGGNTATPTGTNTTYFGRQNYYNYYVYDGTYWVWAGSSADNNTTYTPQTLGFGYATCSTEAATTAKVATLSGYSLVTNGIVSVKFTNSVPANATLNINNRGAKSIYYQGANIVAGVIKAGDIATFVYSGNYNLICIDRGSNGHIIVDSSGSQLASENSLQFADSHVSDDSTNGRTVIENIKEHTTKADYENATEDGIHVIDDGNDVPIGTPSEDYVEVTADGVKTYGALLNELYALMDVSKLSECSYLTDGSAILRYVIKGSGFYRFTAMSDSDGTYTYEIIYRLNSAQSDIYVWRFKENGSILVTSYTNTVASSGTKITLYYGTSSTVINLKTDANYCQYDENTTVKQAIDNNIYYEDITASTNADGYADIRNSAPIDKTFAVMVIGATYRQCAELFINSANDTRYYAYVHYRGEAGTKVANTSVTLRLWKRR
jgi:hypothetical protein